MANDSRQGCDTERRSSDNSPQMHLSRTEWIRNITPDSVKIHYALNLLREHLQCTNFLLGSRSKFKTLKLDSTPLT